MSETSRLEAFLRGLDQLPPYEGVSFRGRSRAATFGRAARTVVTRGILATSRDPSVALRDAEPADGSGVREVYAIFGQRGRYIAPFSARRDEEEVVFGPGSMFQVRDELVTGADDGPQQVRAVLVVELVVRDGEVVEPPVEIDAFRAAVVRHLTSRVRSGPDPQATGDGIPGKFGGDVE